MRRLGIASLVVLVSASVVGCEEPTAVMRGPAYAVTKIRGGGFDDANNVGSIAGTQWPVSGWGQPADIAVGGIDVDDPTDVCYAFGRCMVGQTLAPGFHPNFTLGGPVNADPNSGACVLPGGTCYGLLSTTNFFEGAKLIITQRSGIVSRFPGVSPLPANTGWVLHFDYAFLTALPAVAQSTDAFAVVLLDEITNDQNEPAATIELFRRSRSQLQDGSVTTKAGGCGDLTLGGVTSSYPLCTGWRNESIDVSFAAGRNVRLRIYVDEGGIDAGVATSFAIDNLKFEETVLVGPVTASVSPAISNKPVTVTAGFTDTEIGATHTAVIEWGDGSSSPGTITEPAGVAGSVTGSHAYAAPGAYSGSITVSDGSGAPGQGRFVIVVRAPSAAEDIEALIARVNALNLGPLRKSTLRHPLERALANVRSDQPGAAVFHMSIFIGLVKLYRAAGILTPQQGMQLRAAAEAIIRTILSAAGVLAADAAGTDVGAALVAAVTESRHALADPMPLVEQRLDELIRHRPVRPLQARELVDAIRMAVRP